jgi:UDP-N-acetyl-D-mannosaminuronic acid dehydrogenase
VKPILDKSGKKYMLAFCPERTIEGKALEELKELPQIIGGLDEESVDMAFDLFKKVTNTTIKMSSLEAAEMVKLLCNSYRDMTFAYANEVALICEKIGLDPFELIKSANIGYDRSKIPLPGFVGGSCLEKDPYILADCIDKTGYKAKMIATSREINESIVPYVIEKIKRKVSKEGKIFVSGIAFKGKPDTDDLRGSVAIKVIEELKKEGYYNIYVHDFVVQKAKINDMKFVELEEGFRDAECVLIGNNNDRYNYIEIDNYLKLMKSNSLFFDVWNIFSQKQINENGRVYAGIGK